jgi:tRNA pseudouridine55 synthase
MLALQGEVELAIPAASAVKVDGERAYRLHRRGLAVEMPTRRSEIHHLRIRRYAPPLVELELHVSSGTYVRAIADALGGHCRWLRRTAVGPFRVEDADESRVLPLLAALVHLPERRLDDEEVQLVRTGRSLQGAGEGPVALWTGAGELVGVGVADGGTIRPETVVA